MQPLWCVCSAFGALTAVAPQTRLREREWCAYKLYGAIALTPSAHTTVPVDDARVSKPRYCALAVVSEYNVRQHRPREGAAWQASNNICRHSTYIALRPQGAVCAHTTTQYSRQRSSCPLRLLRRRVAYLLCTAQPNNTSTATPPTSTTPITSPHARAVHLPRKSARYWIRPAKGGFGCVGFIGQGKHDGVAYVSKADTS